MTNQRPRTASPAMSRQQPDPDLRKLAQIVESSSEAMIACDLEGRVETWNGGGAQIFGHAGPEMIGRHVSDLIQTDRRDEFTRLLREAAHGQSSELFRTSGQHREGHAVHLSVSLTPMRDGDGTVTGVCMVARDVSARRRAEEEAEQGRRELLERERMLREALTALRNSHEELKLTQLQLIQSAKLESVGRLAAGVAHEVKNPLAMILAGTEYLLSLPATSGGPAVEPLLRDIRAAVGRASTVIAGLLNYAAATDLDPSDAEINAVLEQSLLLVQHALKRSHVHVEKELAAGLPKLKLDVAKMEQVFINLFINAIDAMPQGGRLTIRTCRKQLTAGDESAGRRRTDTLRVGENVILVTVEDTGIGFPVEHLPKLGDPFFTTKPTGKGTGLGLAVSKTIIALHGGTIRMSNRPEGGASVDVALRSITA